jgi:hypothetical protein
MLKLSDSDLNKLLEPTILEKFKEENLHKLVIAETKEDCNRILKLMEFTWVNRN